MINCLACQVLLQESLEGQPLSSEPAVAAHLAACPDCASRQAAVLRLLAGLRALPVLAPPAGLSDRVVEMFLAERRRTRRRWVACAGLGVAAAVLLVVGGFTLLRRDGVPGDPGIVEVTRPASEFAPGVTSEGASGGKPEVTPSLRESVTNAGTALASLSSRTADVTLGPTGSLLPRVSAPVDPRLLHEPADLAPPGEVAGTRSLAEAGAELSAGLEPVATSARRAFGLFLRDLPMGLDRSGVANPG